MQGLILLILSYFLGGVPFGFITAYLVKRIDIRKFGSGNIGATNVFRVVGKKWGVLVFILDFVKGLIPPVIIKFFLGQPSSYIFIAAAILAVCGHNWTPYLKFKGGKGVATSLGAVSGLSFVFHGLGMALLLSIGVWLITFLISRYVSLASIISAFIFFVSSLVFLLPLGVKILSFCLFVFILVRHKSNIQKLFAKKEFRF